MAIFIGYLIVLIESSFSTQNRQENVFFDIAGRNEKIDDDVGYLGHFLLNIPNGHSPLTKNNIENGVALKKTV